MKQRIRRRLLLPITASLAFFSMIAPAVDAYTGGTTVPGWGNNATSNPKAGPLGLTTAGTDGEIPVAIQIPDADVDAEVEKNHINDGQMLDPSGPWVVSWYQETGKAGDTRVYRNMVMAGHVDYWDVGPAVFKNVANLGAGAQIRVTGAGGTVFTYAVSETYQVPAQPDQKQLDDIVAPQATSVLTIITCGGDFDQSRGEYDERTIVRATLVDTEANAVQGQQPKTAEEDSGGGAGLQEGDTATVNTPSVNVRSQPSTSGSIVATLNQGDSVLMAGGSIVAEGYTWWPVTTSDGTSGWVAEDFLTRAAQ